MTDFKTWRATGRSFRPADAIATFGWTPLTQPVRCVYVYAANIFIEILLDGTPVFGGVAMGDLQMAEEAAFSWLRATKVA